MKNLLYILFLIFSITFSYAQEVVAQDLQYATSITSEGIRVTFKNSNNSQYAFDEPTKALNRDYKELNGKITPFKAVENKKTEPFIASVELTDNSISVDSLIFKTTKGRAIESRKVGNDYELTLKGLYSDATEEVQAVIKQRGKYQVAGAFNLVHISPKAIKLNLIPTSGVHLSESQIEEVKNIYKKIPEDIATGWVVKALEDLQEKGVKSITNIPWNGVN
ncbi:hypothetical protein [Riemerella columbipharyngis]|uniref:GLPGLI family protein n=1 Tax=Riemerella columbipharyngis TaxID=1071918 RepID=A0A1G7BPL1_9FLAO|nr:hypothetical protein [Riemerella columbipharyngis]SDE29034.1 hypothetical protein SAMN05421544_10675 [Riemerella columbipharyngis]